MFVQYWHQGDNLLSHASAEYCEKYAKPEDAGITPEDKSSDEELSDDDDDDDNDSGDEAILGNPDP
jgi:ubiquitin-conjugating enzyme E2 H